MERLVKTSKIQSKVKSITSEGNKAITRSYYYTEDGKDYTGIAFEVLYFVDTKEEGEDDNYVRKIGNKFVFKRNYNMKLDTLMLSLYNLGILIK